MTFLVYTFLTEKIKEETTHSMKGIDRNNQNVHKGFLNSFQFLMARKQYHEEKDWTKFTSS